MIRCLYLISNVFRNVCSKGKSCDPLGDGKLRKQMLNGRQGPWNGQQSGGGG
jgi:hypothetical protein